MYSPHFGVCNFVFNYTHLLLYGSFCQTRTVSVKRFLRKKKEKEKKSDNDRTCLYIALVLSKITFETLLEKNDALHFCNVCNDDIHIRRNFVFVPYLQCTKHKIDLNDAPI